MATGSLPETQRALADLVATGRACKDATDYVITR